MLGGDSTVAQFTPYKDGVLTKRNTFQKYYTRSELRSYIETSLNTDAIAIGPGIFFVFKDSLDTFVAQAYGPMALLTSVRPKDVHTK
jgi:DNA phosphorothioation-associated putative methyltransferase